MKAASSEGGAGASKLENPVKGSKGRDDGEKMNALLEEANKMLAVFRKRRAMMRRRRSTCCKMSN